MAVQTYRVVLEGRTLDAREAGQVAANLGQLFRQPAERLVSLLQGDPTVVKRSLDEATALHYQSAVRLAGAACRIELEHIDVDLALPAVGISKPHAEEPVTRHAGPDVVDERTKTCPFCSESIKAAARVCKHCGRNQPAGNSSVNASTESRGNTATGGEKQYYLDKFAIFDANSGKFKPTFNWAALLFGPFWYFYKELWVKATISIAITFLLVGAPIVFFWLYWAIAGNYDYYLLKRHGTQLWKLS